MEEKSSGATRDFGAAVAHHREYFRSGNTRPVKWREAQLTSLQAMVTERAEDFHDALWDDLRRSRTYTDVAELKHVAYEAAHARKRLRSWIRPQRVRTPPHAAGAHGGAVRPIWGGSDHRDVELSHHAYVIAARRGDCRRERRGD